MPRDAQAVCPRVTHLPSPPGGWQPAHAPRQVFGKGGNETFINALRRQGGLDAPEFELEDDGGDEGGDAMQEDAPSQAAGRAGPASQQAGRARSQR